MSLHPSTVSRWKREVPDLAILLRAAREEFRLAQLEVIYATAHAGHATSWRAAAWLLERIFPEDYAPRARERAQFQERFDAVCAEVATGRTRNRVTGPSCLQSSVPPAQSMRCACQ